MKRLVRKDPKNTELKNELYEMWNKELRHYWLNVGCMKAGGQRPRGVTASAEMCKTCLQMARHSMNVGSIHSSMVQLFHLGAEVHFLQYHEKSKAECVSSAHKSFLEDSPDSR